MNGTRGTVTASSKGTAGVGSDAAGGTCCCCGRRDEGVGLTVPALGACPKVFALVLGTGGLVMEFVLTEVGRAMDAGEAPLLEETVRHDGTVPHSTNGGHAAASATIYSFRWRP